MMSPAVDTVSPAVNTVSPAVATVSSAVNIVSPAIAPRSACPPLVPLLAEKDLSAILVKIFQYG
jgi:hypothetical protein